MDVCLSFRWWMYGDKVLSEQQVKGEMRCFCCELSVCLLQQMCNRVFFWLLSAGDRVRGWFPRRCVEKCHYDTAASDNTSDKKVN